MTHSLHRTGSKESLQNDFVVLSFANSKSKLTKYKYKLQKKHPKVFANIKACRALLKSFLKIILNKHQESTVKKANNLVFTNRDDLVNYIKKMKQADKVESIVVSGLIDEVKSALQELGMNIHTIQFSLGHFGKTNLLPEDDVLDITTMCGHQLIKDHMVRKLADNVKSGRMTSIQATDFMSGLCFCGIFNNERAKKLIDKIVTHDNC